MDMMNQLMKQTNQVNVGGVDYNIGQVSAIEQLKLLNEFGSKLVFIGDKIKQEIKIDIDVLVGCIIVLEENELQSLQNLLVYKIFKNGDSKNIDISNFQGNILNFVKLIAEAIKFNLSDFLDYLDNTKTTESKETSQVM